MTSVPQAQKVIQEPQGLQGLKVPKVTSVPQVQKALKVKKV